MTQVAFQVDASALGALSVELVTNAGRIGAKVGLAIRKTAYDIEGAAKMAAPVDTGTLRSSISTTITGDGRSGSMVAEVGPTVEYAAFVEEGTSRMAPQPYLGPAFDQHAETLVTVFEAMGGELL